MTLMVVLAILLIMLHFWQASVADAERVCQSQRECRLALLGVQVERLRSAAELSSPEEARRVAGEVKAACGGFALGDPVLGESLTSLLDTPHSNLELAHASQQLARLIERTREEEAENSRQRLNRQAWLEGLLLLWLGWLALAQSRRKRSPHSTTALKVQLDELKNAGRDLLHRYQVLNRSNRELMAELSAAGRVQRALLPQQPPLLADAEVAWMLTACSHVAGDMFNVIELDERHLGVWILDVSGHGIPAALLSVSVSRVMHANPLQGGMLRRPKLGAPSRAELAAPALVATELNRRFPQAKVAGLYFTLLYAVLDTTTGLVTYVRCGHPAPIVVSSGAAQAVESTGCLPIGLFEEAEYHEETVQLQAGDCLVLYTDGITDCRGPSGDYGEERMLEVLSRPHGEAALVMESLKSALAGFSAGYPQRDDQTAICVTWRPVRVSSVA